MTTTGDYKPMFRCAKCFRLMYIGTIEHNCQEAVPHTAQIRIGEKTGNRYPFRYLQLLLRGIVKNKLVTLRSFTRWRRTNVVLQFQKLIVRVLVNAIIDDIVLLYIDILNSDVNESNYCVSIISDIFPFSWALVQKKGVYRVCEKCRSCNCDSFLFKNIEHIQQPTDGMKFKILSRYV